MVWLGDLDELDGCQVKWFDGLSSYELRVLLPAQIAILRRKSSERQLK